MSKKSKWRFVSSTDPYKLLSSEEKVAYKKEKEEERRKAFKMGETVRRMSVEKPKFNKPSSHKNTKEREEDMEEE